jgi:ectoine hydroxylase-related dioxygenase (phytanoyl-CoA dioxygenase family)
MPEYNPSGDLVAQYHRLGYVGPIKAFEPEEMEGVAEAVRQEVHSHNYNLASKRNRHLDWSAIALLAMVPAIIRCAKQVLENDELVLWRTNIFIGQPGRGARWHQDQYRTLLADPLHHVSMHLAISAATPDNCVMLVPGSHKLTKETLPKAGFHYIEGTDAGAYGAPAYWRDPSVSAEIVKMTLRPGEFFIFHPSTLHGSYDLTHPRRQPKPVVGNPDTLPRVGLAIRITVPGNEVLPAAFAETLPRPDHCVVLKA